MLFNVKTKNRKIEEYKDIISEELFWRIKSLAQKLKGLKVIHINSTVQGGGVAEILKSLIPLMNGVGIDTQWYVIPPEKNFFNLTKQLHNALQGGNFVLNSHSRRLYQDYMKRLSRMMRNVKADLLIVHDPQPLGLIDYLKKADFSSMISRIHIDTSHPNREVWEFLKGFMLKYDKVIFSSSDFIHQDIPRTKIEIFLPAIDPLSEKNKLISSFQSKSIIKTFGIDTNKPLVVQVSRFDIWKDPMGAIKAYRIAKKKIPGLQLALIGLFLAQDDPEAMTVFEEVERSINNDDNIFLFSNPNKLNGLEVDRFINAFQSGADVVLQKSIREGFGLSVTEAMWKGKAVIGGKTGGIKLQIEDGKSGFLVSSPEQAAEKIVTLIKNPNLRKRLGMFAKETVRQNFLMPRLLENCLDLFEKL